MKPPAKLPSSPAGSDIELAAMVEDMLGLLAPYRSPGPHLRSGGKPLQSLLEQCRAMSDRLRATPPEPLRVLHHFACTGGTLIARALACQPGTSVLSEVDPFSGIFVPGGGFAPSDLIHLARQDRSPPDDAVVAEMFLAQLEVLVRSYRRQGRHLVLRDHSHSHFCAGDRIGERPLLGRVLAARFPLKSAITVRHPLDSFISLQRNGWVHFQPATLDAYAQRYLAFLDSYRDLPVFRYEAFTADPQTECAALCDHLGLETAPDWQDWLPTVRLSGDSGRRGDTIAPRPPRLPEAALRAEAEASAAYQDLCARLGYGLEAADD